jgi:hypothetical protein
MSFFKIIIYVSINITFLIFLFYLFSFVWTEVFFLKKILFCMYLILEDTIIIHLWFFYVLYKWTLFLKINNISNVYSLAYYFLFN